MGAIDDGFDVLGCLRVLADADPDRCSVAPSPELKARIEQAVEALRADDQLGALTARVAVGRPKAPGLDDGVIVPGSYFPLGTSIDRVRGAAADRGPLHGTLRVVVVLVDFADQEMTETPQHFEELFFSTGVLPNGSVREYFTEVTNGLVEITGQVAGPYRLPRTMAEYANGASGTGPAQPNARTMARDAALSADADIDFAPFDNDGDGFVDAYIVVHAGPGGEQTGSTGHIWSHKWVLAGGELATDTTKVFAYLTVPEDARIGVCAHELGHLLFGFPDLYDTDNTSEGVGNWCLMAGGSWNGGGDVPAHPSAWCKAQQAWVVVHNVAANTTLSIADVKDSATVYRLWKDGAPGQEHFLVENRQRTGYDAQLPGEGLLVWHIDDAVANNTDETHYRVALVQADGAKHLEGNANRGDGGDCFPGTAGNRAFSATSTPGSKSYGGLDTCVSITAISDAGPVMTASVKVRCGKAVQKDLKDHKDGRKDVKDRIKDVKEKDVKEVAEKPDIDKGFSYDKPSDRKLTDGWGRPWDRPWGRPLGWAPEGVVQGGPADPGELEARLAALEEAVFGGGEPFIGGELRPDLRDSALAEEAEGVDGPVDKRDYDTRPPGRG